MPTVRFFAPCPGEFLAAGTIDEAELAAWFRARIGDESARS